MKIWQGPVKYCRCESIDVRQKTKTIPLPSYNFCREIITVETGFLKELVVLAPLSTIRHVETNLYLQVRSWIRNQ